MFSLILKNLGHKSTMRPLMLQTRNFKRDITPEDLNKESFSNKFDEPGDKNGKDLYYPKYGSSIYDDKFVLKKYGHRNINNKYDVEDKIWTNNEKEKIYKDRED